ncbi:MAG: YraN family protein [Thiolinea sp.]
MKTETSKALGDSAEDLACAYLQAQGLHLLMRNYRLRSGEIDLVLRDKTHLVFVEVRYRKTQQFGGALYSIDRRKQQKIINTAQHYLQRYRVTLPVRFDVVAISGKDDIQWLQNAFETSY